MLAFDVQGEDGPLIVMLHWLSGSSHAWQPVAQSLVQGGMRCAALDLPGFGETPTEQFSLAGTVDQIIQTVRSLRDANDKPWLLAGHSMGGKLAMLVARAAADQTPGLEGLSGIFLVSPSPASPEPMKESKRTELLETLGQSSGDEAQDYERAGKFVDDNTGKLPLEATLRESAIADLLRMDRRAFAAWLTDGSKQDLARHVGLLPYPALILAGSEEPELGPEAQRKLAAPAFARATVVELQGAGHLAPLERPAELADRILIFARELGLAVAPRLPQLNPSFQQLLDSDRTSPQTRAVMQARVDSAKSASTPFTQEAQLTLQALVRRVVPDAPLDLAGRVTQWLETGSRDGWRFDNLPSDFHAWQQGLASLNAAALSQYCVPFSALYSQQQDALLNAARQGELGKTLAGKLGVGETAASLTATQMQQWFEDVRSALARLYIADPRTMQRVGFTGFADDHGFTHISLGDNHTA